MLPGEEWLPAMHEMSASGLEPERWVDDYADYLYRFALARVRSPETARDLVQETFLAALKARGSYAGRAAERTWLTGILKNKIVDFYRRGQREPLLGDLLDRQEDEDFNPDNGHWRFPSDVHPRQWQEEQIAHMDRPEFWKRFTACADKLPEQTRRVFVLREVDGWESPAICREMGISSQNYWTIMHRARAALRRCLEVTWFAAK